MDKQNNESMKNSMDNSKEKAINDPMAKNGVEKFQESRNQRTGKNPALTNEAGIPVLDDELVMTAGTRGPMTLTDPWVFEKQAHFNREKIPERRMHSKGSGAFGTFTVTNDITKYTKAKIFSEVGKETEMFARFSTVAGSVGAADAERDIRGFALKFYTEDGNWDLVGNNTPVFFVREPKTVIDLTRSLQADPRSNLRAPNATMDFLTRLPESLYQLTITMSDRGIPSSYRYNHGSSSHAYSMINEENEKVWVMFHFRAMQGIQNLTDQEAGQVIAGDRDSHQRDLYNAIENEQFPKWKMYIQVMTEEEANELDYNPFDLTKVWYKKDFPPIEVGVFELNRNPDNYFADVEQASFTPANIIPGIGYSPDRMLLTRIFAYGDAFRYRVGVNAHQIPVNYPHGADNFHSSHRNGAMRVDGNLGSETNNAVNSYGNFTDHSEKKEPLMKGGDIGYTDFREDDHDYYTQPGELFRAMTSEQQLVLFENTARFMGDSTLQIKHRHINNCHQADPDYGKGIAKALNIDIDTVDLSPTPRDSKKANEEANTRGADLDVPTEPITVPESARDLGPEGRDTNVEDPTTLTDPMDDPYFL
jgi:catalase